MTITNGINPDNPKQASVFFSLIGRHFAGVRSWVHPQQEMRDLGHRFGFTVIASVPQSIADGWDFWIEYSSPPEGLPDYIYGRKWKPVGQA